MKSIIKPANYIYHILALLIFFMLLYLGSAAPDSALQILLRPYTALAELFFNSSHEYIPNVGYVEANNRYVIGRSCLGINFTALTFIMCVLRCAVYKPFRIFLCLLGSIIAGFTANSMRILSSIPFASHEKFNLIHASLGIVIYLSFLTFFYTKLRSPKP